MSDILAAHNIQHTNERTNERTDVATSSQRMESVYVEAVAAAATASAIVENFRICGRRA